MPLSIRTHQILQFAAVLKSAAVCAFFFALVGSCVSQAQLLCAFRRDTLLEVYWRMRDAQPALAVCESHVDVQLQCSAPDAVAITRRARHVPSEAPLPDLFAHHVQSLTGAPLLFGYAICNAVFLGFVLWLVWLIAHVAIGTDVIRTTIYDVLLSRWSLVDFLTSLLDVVLIAFRLAIFWFVQVADANGVPRITQYRWYCFLDLFYLLFAYHIGFVFIAVRLALSIADKAVGLFRLDVSQLPPCMNGFDPLHNAYLSAVLIEAQMQVELVEARLAQADAI